MSYSGTVLLDATDPGSTVMWTCAHQHKTPRAAQACGNAEAKRQNAEIAAKRAARMTEADSAKVKK